MPYDLATLAEGIKRANAKGDTASVQKLGQAYRQLQAQQPTGPSSAIRAGQDIAYAGQYDNQKPAPNLLDSTLATVNGLTSSVPFLQQASDAVLAGGQTVGDMATGEPADFGGHFNAIQDQRKATAEKAPLANAAGSLVGTLALPAAAAGTKLGAEALGIGGSFGKQLLNSTASTAAYEGAQGLAHGHTGAQLLTDEGIGAAGGAAGATIGKVVEKTGEGIADALTNTAQKKLTDTAVKGAPSAADLAAVSRADFKAADDAGVSVNMPAFSKMVHGLVQDANAMHIHPELDKKAVPAYQTLINALRQSEQAGKSLALSDLHILRQIAQKVAISSDGRDYDFAKQIINGLDGFIRQPGALKLPPNRLGEGMGASEAGNALLRAIGTWAKSRKTGLVEDAIAKAELSASGKENGLRVEFRKLLANEGHLFSGPERAALTDVIKGNAVSNAAKLAGMFGFNLGSGSKNVVGGSIGLAMGGPVGLAAGMAARKASEHLTTKAAERAARAAATDYIPAAVQRQNNLLPAAKLLNILVRGGAVAHRN